MANVFDYLDWRGDLTFGQAPCNEIDSLIFSLISYVDFDGIVPSAEEGGDVSLLDAARAYVRQHRGKPAYVGLIVPPEVVSLMAKAAKSKRFGALRMSAYENRVEDEVQMQFCATTYTDAEGDHCVAFRGTDSTIVGWREDFNMAFESPVPAQSAAVKYLNEAAALTDGPLILGGHSKGGNLAVYAAAHADPMTQSRIRAVYSFDGPGLDDATMASEGYANIARRIRSFVPQHSVVGLLLTYHPEYTVVKSDGVGLLQHDSFTWQVLGTSFIPVTEVDVSSQLVDQTVHAWLSQVSPEKRRIFVNTIFDVLEASGANTVKELVRNIPSRLPAVLKALQQVDAETARMVLTLWGQFVTIGATNIIELVRQRLTPDNTEHIQGDATHGTES